MAEECQGLMLKRAMEARRSSSIPAGCYTSASDATLAYGYTSGMSVLPEWVGVECVRVRGGAVCAAAWVNRGEAAAWAAYG